MDLFIIRDLIQWASWEDILLIWKIYLPAGGNSVVVCNSTGAIVSVVLKGVNLVVVDVELTP